MKSATAVMMLVGSFGPDLVRSAGLVDNPIVGSHIQYLDSTVGTSILFDGARLMFLNCH